MIWVILFVTLLPTLFEVWNDRNGEGKKSKVKDGIWLVVGSALIAGGAWWLGYRPLPVIGLILGWRVLIFDYLTHIFLKEFSKSHENIEWWSYTGKTTYWWDQLIAKISWKLRLAVRVLIFAATIYPFVVG